jgi:hypothetical protein
VKFDKTLPCGLERVLSQLFLGRSLYMGLKVCVLVALSGSDSGRPPARHIAGGEWDIVPLLSLGLWALLLWGTAAPVEHSYFYIF